MAKTQIKTPSGFSCKIDENAVNDFRLLAAIRHVENGDTMAVVDIVEALLDKDTAEKLYKHCERKDGKADIKMVCDEVSEMFKQLNGIAKKS